MSYCVHCGGDHIGTTVGCPNFLSGMASVPCTICGQFHDTTGCPPPMQVGKVEFTPEITGGGFPLGNMLVNGMTPGEIAILAMLTKILAALKEFALDEK